MRPPTSSPPTLATSSADVGELRRRARESFRQGRLEEAHGLLERALATRPDDAELCNNLGVVLAEQGRHAEALALYDRALAVRPDYAHAHHNRGNALRRLGRPGEAVHSYEQALRWQPESADTRNNLGVALLALGRAAEAAAAFREALRLRPEHAEAQGNLGVALAEQGHLAEAAAVYRQALRLRPRSPEAHNNLGVALAGQGRLDEALALYRRALRLRPDYPEAHNNLGNALRQLGELGPAAEALGEALRLKPDYAEAHNNLAIVRVRQGEIAAALAAYDEAVRLRPDYAEAHTNRALAWLAAGDFGRGWGEYDWRWRTKDFPKRSFEQPRWDGEDLEGRTILLYAEQGLGDTLQFIRYAALVKRRGGVVVAEVQPALVPLLRRCGGIDQLLPAGSAPPDFDVQAPLLSLPALLHTTLDTVPAEVPYLSPDPELARRWGEELRAVGGFKVGIAWQGSPTFRDDRHRSIPLRHFEPLARLAGVRLVSLQKGHGREQLAPVAAQWGVVDWADRLDESGGAFTDTAAVMRHLDLVVTSDTSVAHLAGALGVPVWVALPAAADWRWLLDREDCPWYPTMRLFRQKSWGDWDDVFARVAAELRRQRPEGVEPPIREAPPELPPPCNNRGVDLVGQGRLEEAAAVFGELIRRHPQSAEAHNNLGIVRLKQGDPEGALAAYEEALRLKPDLAAARANRAWVWLLRGDFARGWPEHERYCRGAGAAPRAFPQPAWRGEPLGGRTILLYAEHGLGDTLHLARYAALVKQRGGVVLAEVPPALAPLMCSCTGIDRVLPAGSPLPDFDVQASLLSLPGLFHTTPETVPASVPYLSADPERVRSWGEELRAAGGFKVGIAWQGDPRYPEDRHRSVPLHYFEPLARLPGVRLVSLQKNHGREQLGPVASGWNVLDLADRLDESGGAFTDTAAVMRHLDLVVACDTSVAHLAGALGVPVWVALATACDWRWLLDREDCPWYPSMRLFRQRRWGDWGEVFSRIAGEVARRLPGGGTAPQAPADADAERLRRQGRELCARGRYAEAVGYLRRALRLGPGSAVARNNLGVALARQGQLAEAVRAYREALRLRPGYAEAHHNLGEALQQQGQHDEARACYEQALRLKSGLAQTHNNLGVLLAARGEARPACEHYREALRLQPDFALAHSNLAAALEKLGERGEAAEHYERALRGRFADPSDYLRLADERVRQRNFAEAVAACRLALALRPDDAEARLRLGRALLQLGDPAEAAARLEEVLRQRPDDTDALSQLGDCLRRLGRPAEAEGCYRRALQLRPGSGPLHNHLGIALIDQGRPAEAEAAFRDAVRCEPRHAPAHNNLGVALEQQGRMAEAVRCYQESARLDPAQPDTHKNLALARLLCGDFARGWPEYEWRWKCVKAARRSFQQPRWDGGDVEGWTILLYAEQGLGDTLQFIRYAALVRRRGGTVFAEVQPALVPLLRRCEGIDRLIAGGSPLPPFDVQAPLLSLPALLHTTLDTVPAEVPYLSPDPELARRWGEELRAVEGFKVGIAWQGSNKYAGDRHRSVPLKHFQPLARLPGVRLVSLQKNLGREQLGQVASDWGVLDLGDRLDESGGAFTDTAAVMAHLDLVVTSDTAVAHLAGALGVPVWLALPVARDWRWLLDREDCPWYPTMRLFRQRRWGDWDEVFTRIAAEVDRLRPRAALRRPLVAEVSPGELVDKVTILEIKRARLADSAKREHVLVELGALQAARARALREPPTIAPLVADLRRVNERLWDVEDELRRCEAAQEFGPRFVDLARSVYGLNDERARLKRRVNEMCGSALVEEKSYAGT